MSILSKSLMVVFELANECYIAVGAGALGMAVLLKHSLESNQYFKTISVIGLTTVSWLYITGGVNRIQPNRKKVIFITGCDSGLGFSLAQHSADLGFTVFAGFLCLESKGAKEIRKLYAGTNAGTIIQIKLDITDISSIQAAVQTVEHYFSKNPGHYLHAVINNAGIMIFGEFEWLTDRLIQQQINVNLLGTFKFTNAMCPLLRQHKGRLITITSHCSQAALPGVAVYTATKVALRFWNDALRIELSKYGVDVLTFIPGSFVLQSNIMSKQLQYVQDMHDSFTAEQHTFYSDYFKRYNIYLSAITCPQKPVKIDDKKMYEVFEGALLDRFPKPGYKNESFRYWLYHLLFKITPTCIRDYLIVHFMQMPKYIPERSREYEDLDEYILEEKSD